MSASQEYITVPEPAESTVFVRTLGILTAAKGHHNLAWTGSGVGARKLKCGFSYLLAHRDAWVLRTELNRLAKTNTIVSGIRVMLRSWGMSQALQQRDRRIMLASHDSWMTDTDRLDQLLNAAQYCRSNNDISLALSFLNQAEKLCGGPYLPDYDALPEYSIDDEVAHWQQRQKEALRTVAEVRQLEEDRSLCAAAIAAAIRAIRFDRENPDSYLFAARIARRCGNEGLARLYELRAP